MALRDLPAGSNHSKEVPAAIRNCQVFVLILSRNAQASPWVLKELDSAVSNGKVVLPFMLEEFELNDEFNFLLTGAQRYSAYQKKAEVMETFISRIRALTNTSGTPTENSTEGIKEDTPSLKVNFSVPLSCPACGSTNLIEVKSKLLSFETAELLILSQNIFLMSCGFPLCIFIGLKFIGFLYSHASEFLSSITPILLWSFFFWGGIFGTCLGIKNIRSRRIRMHIRPQLYRCKTCDKRFFPIEK